MERALIRIGNAPTSWGIEKPEDPTYPTWSVVLDEMAAAGYEGTELGPLGYFPADPARLADELAKRGLALSAGNIMTPLSHRDDTDAVVAAATAVCDVLQKLDARLFVVIDGIEDDREVTAGRSADAPRLDPARWRVLIETVERVAEVALERGIVPAFHPHAGTHVEFADEVERLLTDTAPGMIELCVDTGHSAFAGIDPVALLGDHADRVAYVHVKDVDAARLDRARAEGLGFWDAYSSGVFCVLGSGGVDLAAVARWLADSSYDGWLTVEQDASPTGESVPATDASHSREVLRRLGIGEEAK